MSYSTLILEFDGPVAVLTLNRPGRLNAINQETREEFVVALEEVREQQARALVVTGAGRGFCSGADVETLPGAGSSDNYSKSDVTDRFRPTEVPWILRLKDFETPTIAAVNGVAAGAGFSLAMACDTRIAAESARFTASFVKRGLVPDGGCTWLLPRIAGVANAFELMYTGKIIAAEEAARMGIVSRVVPDDQVVAEATSLASEIAKGPPVALEFIKRITYTGLSATLEQACQYEVYSNGICHDTEDHREGVRAFLEKRDPVSRDR